MSDGAADAPLVAKLGGSVGAFAAADWDALDPSGNPFVSHAFLTALEDSGSVGRGSGWQPAPIVIEDGEGTLRAALPAYLKGHSQGEYVFDHAWADAFERAGGRYYPKLQIAAPFTPATGPRLLLADEALARPLLEAAQQLCSQNGFSSAHASFIEDAQQELFEQAGWMLRHDVQFHWHNRGYGSFEDFLGDLSSRKRKDLRKERAAAQGAVTIKRLRGDEIRPEHWDAFWIFYQDTGSRKWGTPYLTREAFDLFQQRMGDSLLLVLAFEEGEPVAPARSISSAAMRSTGVTGAARGTSASCISSCAIIRRSTRRSSSASPASRRGRRAGTSWRGVTSPSPPSRRTGSPSRALPRRWRISSSASAKAWRRTGCSLANGRRSAKPRSLGDQAARRPSIPSHSRARRCASAISRALISSEMSARHQAASS